MGFDNECIVNIQSLPGEYFCPVCRTLIYPTEALQTPCTHLYCKPCLAHTAATTQACPYDGYLVTLADSKPLVELNKPLADAIAQVQVHCLYYRSGCQWQGALSDCVVHCTTCAYGNNPVLCNRCSTQIMHRQVQEHAQVCPVVHPQVSQPVDTTQSQAVAAAPTQFAGQNAYATSTGTATGTGAPITASNQEVVGQAALDQWYQQQYYQQYPGYDQYAQYTQQAQPLVAPAAMQPPQSQPAVPHMQSTAPQNMVPQPPHLQSQQLPQSQLQPLPHNPHVQPLLASNSQLHPTLPQGHNPAPSVTGYSSYPQPQHIPAQQPQVHMLPAQQTFPPPPQGPFAPPPQQMAAHQQLHPAGPVPHVQHQRPPHMHSQALSGAPPMGLNYSTPSPPQFHPIPGSLNSAFADKTDGIIKELKEKGFDDISASKIGPISSQNTPLPALSHERYPPPHGHLPDVLPHGHGPNRIPYDGNVRPSSEAPVRPSMGTSPQTAPDAFDPIRWQPPSSFEPSFSGPGMVRANGLHAPLHDEGLRPYPRPPFEGLSRYERPSYPSDHHEFYGRGAEFGHGPPPFRGSRRHEYHDLSSTFPSPGGPYGAKRFGEPVGYSRFGGSGYMPPPEKSFTGGRGSSKKRFLAGWCRICKIDCGTVEGLDSHSQSKDHKKMALDMILSMKQQVSKNPKLLVEQEVSGLKAGSGELELDTTSGK